MPITTFNDGDTVRVIDAKRAILSGAPGSVRNGDTGVVVDVDSSSVRVLIPLRSHTAWWYNQKNVERVVDQPPSDTSDAITLDPADPFERVVMDMVETNRRKRADYAVDGSPWSNFDDVANSLGIAGFNPVDSANFNIEQKSARLRSLRKNGRMDDPANESVADTYLDRAVYSVIALAMHKYPSGTVNEENAA